LQKFWKSARRGGNRMLSIEQAVRLVQPLRGLPGFTREKSVEAAEALQECKNEEQAIRAIKVVKNLRNHKNECWYPSAAQMADCVQGTAPPREELPVGLTGREECPYCFGSGWAVGEASIDCGRCGGSGRDRATGEACWRCQGSGNTTAPGVKECECARRKL
jgi:DnaJ-class molecular chaperone